MSMSCIVGAIISTIAIASPDFECYHTYLSTTTVSFATLVTLITTIVFVVVVCVLLFNSFSRSREGKLMVLDGPSVKV